MNCNLNRYVAGSVVKMYLTFAPVAHLQHQVQCAVGNLHKLLKTITERSETKSKVLPYFALKLLQDLLPEQMMRRMCICCVNTWHKREKLLQRDILVTMNLLLLNIPNNFVRQEKKRGYTSIFWTKYAHLSA